MCLSMLVCSFARAEDCISHRSPEQNGGCRWVLHSATPHFIFSFSFFLRKASTLSSPRSCSEMDSSFQIPAGTPLRFLALDWPLAVVALSQQWGLKLLSCDELMAVSQRRSRYAGRAPCFVAIRGGNTLYSSSYPLCPPCPCVSYRVLYKHDLQDQSLRAGFQKAQCQSALQPLYKSVLDHRQPHAAGHPLWRLSQADGPQAPVRLQLPPSSLFSCQLTSPFPRVPTFPSLCAFIYLFFPTFPLTGTLETRMRPEQKRFLFVVSLLELIASPGWLCHDIMICLLCQHFF